MQPSQNHRDPWFQPFFQQVPVSAVCLCHDACLHTPSCSLARGALLSVSWKCPLVYSVYCCTSRAPCASSQNHIRFSRLGGQALLALHWQMLDTPTSLQILEDTKMIFGTKEGTPFIFPGTGTGGWEVALANTLSPGDKIVTFRYGQFSHLWVDMMKRLGLDVSPSFLHVLPVAHIKTFKRKPISLTSTWAAARPVLYWGLPHRQS